MGKFLVLGIVLIAGCRLESAEKAPWDHIVVVVMENRSVAQVRDLPYLSTIAAAGTEFLQSYGVARPSQPNYLALFSGSTHGIADNLNHDLDKPNLATRLSGRGLRFTTYAEGLPSPGFRGDSGDYRRKHNPAASFTSVPDGEILPFTAFPQDWNRLPEVSFVIPDLTHDMHDGAVDPAEMTGDDWLRTNLKDYADWAPTHRSLLIITFDEPATSGPLSVPVFTVFLGQGVPQATNSQPINHFTVLKFLLESFELAPLALDAEEAAIDLPRVREFWQSRED